MRVLVLANRDFVLYNFRVELLERLLTDNNEVYICLPNGPKVKYMTEMGCSYISVSIDKRGTNPFKDAQLIKDYKRIFREVKPDIILTYTTKVCIYAGIVAGNMGIPYLMNVSGLVVSVDRMERGQGTKSALTEIEENYGIRTTAIVTMAEVVEHLYNRPYKGEVIIDDTLKAAIDDYYKQYGVN